MPKTILIADGPGLKARLAAALPGQDLHPVHSLEQAKRALKDRAFDLILVGVHFDESRMFDLLRHIRSEAPTHTTPVVCVLHHRFGSPAISKEGLEIAARVLAADTFVDLSGFANEDEGNAALRSIVSSLLGI